MAGSGSRHTTNPPGSRQVTDLQAADMAGSGSRHTTNPPGSSQAIDLQAADMADSGSTVDIPQIPQEADKSQISRQQTWLVQSVDIQQIPQEADKL